MRCMYRSVDTMRIVQTRCAQSLGIIRRETHIDVHALPSGLPADRTLAALAPKGRRVVLHPAALEPLPGDEDYTSCCLAFVLYYSRPCLRLLFLFSVSPDFSE